MRIFIPVVAAVVMATAGRALATFHEWLPEEIFSNASGTVQYIEFSDAVNGENLLTNTSITSVTAGNTYHFLTNLASTSTAGHNLLIATPGYAALSGVPTADYVLPTNNFFQHDGGLGSFHRHRAAVSDIYGGAVADGRAHGTVFQWYDAVDGDFLADEFCRGERDDCGPGTDESGLAGWGRRPIPLPSFPKKWLAGRTGFTDFHKLQTDKDAPGTACGICGAWGYFSFFIFHF